MRTITYILLFSLLSSLNAQQLAFPTAIGAGAYTTGGRGGTVIKVTNLNDSGTGSLRAALTASGTRQIIFDISGTINLLSRVNITNGNFTVNGFSAPFPGITIKGYHIRAELANNQIWRGIKFRNGYVGEFSTPSDTPDTYDTCLSIQRCNNVIVDHCSFAYATSKGVSFTATGYSQTDGTISNNLFGESKEATLVGNNSSGDFGSVSYLRNVAVNAGWRHPKGGGNIELDVINNLVHNWKFRIIRMDAGDYTLNIIGNYYQGGVDTSDSDNPEIIFTTFTNLTMSPQIWDEDNFIDAEFKPVGYPADPSLAWDPFFSSTDPIDTDWFVGTRLPIQGVAPTILSSDDLKTELLPTVGACYYTNDSGNIVYYRDAIDTELVTKADTDSSTLSITVANMPSYGSVISTDTNSRDGSYDTDSDGMPDVWETATFGDLTRTGTADFDGDGYTDLEEFLNLVDGVESGNTVYELTPLQKGKSRKTIRSKFIKI